MQRPLELCWRTETLTSHSASTGRTRTGRAVGTARSTRYYWQQSYTPRGRCRLRAKPLSDRQRSTLRPHRWPTTDDDLPTRPTPEPGSVGTAMACGIHARRTCNPYIVMAQSFGDHDPRLYGLDAAVEFPPHKLAVTPPSTISSRCSTVRVRLARHGLRGIALRSRSLPRPPFDLFRCVCPSWDNEARRPGRGMTLAFSDPLKYGRWLAQACRAALIEARHPDERIVFINAWNEWAEGAYLEPDRHFGYAYLAATARVLATLMSQPMDNKLVPGPCFGKNEGELAPPELREATCRPRSTPRHARVSCAPTRQGAPPPTATTSFDLMARDEAVSTSRHAA